MCGIVGLISSNGDEISETKLKEMTDALAHRGPDGDGIWVSQDKQIGLGHRRLSIIDVSDNGRQPMLSASGRYMTSYNGEIYNFLILKKELEALGHVFKGGSDTEVLLASFDQWGIEGALKRIDGMFVIAVADQKTSSLHLARDRVGIKPLYYSLQRNGFIFASELRPLIKFCGELPPISRQGLNEFFRLGYVPAPLSIFEGISKLEPGQHLVFANGQIKSISSYWSIDAVVESGLEKPFSSDEEALDALETQLDESIKRQMISDVPLGAFLSGGIDSSIVTAFMQKHSSKPVKTFSIGFNEGTYNEAVHAAAVAKHLNTDHHELYVTDNDAIDVVPHISDIYDEPFADISQIPTFIVSKLARSQVTVALSGDGGDELFGGYNRYLFASNFWQRIEKYPVSMRKVAAKMISAAGEGTWDSFFKYMRPLMPGSMDVSHFGQKIHKTSKALPADNLQDLHMSLIAKWSDTENLFRQDWHAGDAMFESTLQFNQKISPALQQSLWDFKTYMVDDILTKLDRASMSVGLEARVPLLDLEMIELAWRCPENMKIRNGSGKWLLRQVLNKYVPADLFERPKMGFAVPIDEWLRGALKDWASESIERNKVHQQGFLNADNLNKKWSQHISGQTGAGAELWTALVFQQWLDKTKAWI